MKKWILCVIGTVILFIVGYGLYLYIFILNDRDKCMQYSLNHSYVRCSYEDDNGRTRYCREVRCFNSKTLSENCLTKQECKY